MNFLNYTQTNNFFAGTNRMRLKKKWKEFN